LLRIALHCFCSQAVSSSGQHLLLGGEGVQPSIWDLAAGSKLWQAKGGKPHRQTLLVDKPFTTAVAFLPDSSSESGAKHAAAAAADGDAGDEAAAVKLRFVAGSASSKVHVYDTAAGRRPQTEVVFGETRVTALAPEHDGECATANRYLKNLQPQQVNLQS
jgi:ribosome biogenesis protein NSA1